MRTLKRFLILLTAVATLAPLEAAASGILVARFGGAQGHPTTDHPTAIYYNPAGLALGKGTRLHIDAALALRIATYDRDPAGIDNLYDPANCSETDQSACGRNGTPSDPAGLNDGEGTVTNVLASPFIGVVTDFGVEGLAVGAAFYTPFGGQSKWDASGPDDSRYPGAYSGPQRWWVMEGTIRTLYTSVAAAYTFQEPRLSLGLSANLNINQVHTVRARTRDNLDFVGTPQPDGYVVPSEGRSRVDVSGLTVSIGAGVIWEAMEDTLWVGASYQSQPGFGAMELEGTLDQNVGPQNPDENPTGDSGRRKQDTSLVQQMPDVVRAGARYRVNPELEVRLQGEFVRWSVLENQCIMKTEFVGEGKDACQNFRENGSHAEDKFIAVIPRYWEDAFGVSVGASYWVMPELELLFTAGYDGNAVPDEYMEPALMDFDKVAFSVGADFALLDDSLSISAQYLHVVYFERTISEQAGPGNGLASPSTGPDTAGTYNQMVGALIIGVGYTF